MPQLYTDYPEVSTNDEASGWFPTEEDFEDMAERDAATALGQIEPSRRRMILKQLLSELEQNEEMVCAGDCGEPFPG